MKVMIPASIGELIDKITILELKTEFLRNGDALQNVVRERNALEEVRASLNLNADIDRPTQDLRDVNRALWTVEDDLRDMERAQKFDVHFIDKARAVYKLNDRRAAIKREINTMTGSTLVEEKSYKEY